jgi:hypothetical protein
LDDLASHTTPRPALPHLACLAPAKPWPSPLVIVVGPPGRLDGVLNIVKSEDGGSGTVVEQPPTTIPMCHTADQKQTSAVDLPASR